MVVNRELNKRLAMARLFRAAVFGENYFATPSERLQIAHAPAEYVAGEIGFLEKIERQRRAKQWVTQFTKFR